MSEAYEQEQRQLKGTVENSQSEIDRYDEINDNINNFVSLVVKTGRIKKLTPEIVRLLIDKVIVSEKVKTEDGYKRTVTRECQEKCVSFWVRLNFHTSALGFGTWN